MKKMKKSLIILLFIALFTGTAFADNTGEKKSGETPATFVTIKGVVLDKYTNEALVGVKVIIPELDMKVYTDLDGNFEFKDVLKSEYILESEMISYKKQNLKVSTCSDELKIMMDNK